MLASDTFPSSKDSYVDENNPDVNFGSGSYMYVRSLATAKNQRILVEFDISSIPVGSTIDVATLKLYARYSSAEGRIYQTAKIIAAWEEMSVTWNNKPAVSGLKQTLMVAANNWFLVDVKTFVQELLASGLAGFRVKDKNENSAIIKTGTFCTKEHATSWWRPELYVEWTLPVVEKELLMDGFVIAESAF